MFEVQRTGDWKELGEVLKTMPQRISAFSRRMAQLTAESFLNEVREKLPKSPRYQVYRDALEVKQIEQTSEMRRKVIHSYAVVASPVLEDMSLLDIKTTIIYVLGGTSIGNVLAQYNPYTIDTLPVYKGIEKQKYVYRQVTEGEVTRIRQASQRVSNLVIENLSKIGVVARIGARQMHLPVLKDIVFQALRMEFGIMGEQSIPIWRRVVKNPKPLVDTVVSQHKELGNILFGRGKDYQQLLLDQQTPKMREDETKAFKEFAQQVTQ